MEKTIDHRLAWLAGIIDGEGYIGLGVERVSGGSAPEKTYTAARWVVEVCNTDAAMLAEVMSIGDVIGAKPKWRPHSDRRRRHCKPLSRASFETKLACEIVLRAVLPYLVTKRARAELMLRALLHRKPRSWIGRDGTPFVPVSSDIEFQDMLAQMRELNRRGIAPKEE